MSEFSDRPFVAGELVGLRSFKIDSLGRLTGVVRRNVFKPGENEATCEVASLSSLYPSYLSAAYLQTMRDIERLAAKTTPKVEHPVGRVGCGCGYYAYLDAGFNPHHAEGQVLGIIRGYGTCTVGSRGFRAAKAELVGLVIPRAPWWHGFTSWKFNAVIAAWCALWLIFDITGQKWISAGIQAALFAANAAYAVWHYRKPKVALDVDLLARNYPGVPVYKSTKAALAAHPLTEPEPVTPETADDFWTRSAS